MPIYKIRCSKQCENKSRILNLMYCIYDLKDQAHSVYIPLHPWDMISLAGQLCQFFLIRKENAYWSMSLPRRAVRRGRREVQLSNVKISFLSVIIPSTSAVTCNQWIKNLRERVIFFIYPATVLLIQIEDTYSVISHLLYRTYRVFYIIPFPISTNYLQFGKTI